MPDDRRAMDVAVLARRTERFYLEWYCAKGLAERVFLSAAPILSKLMNVYCNDEAAKLLLRDRLYALNMKKTFLQMGVQSLMAGIISVTFLTWAYAGDSISKLPDVSGESSVSPYLTDVQKDKLLSILDEAMAILRDDAAFDPAHTVFGKIIPTLSDIDALGSRYEFHEPSLHTVLYRFITSSDPLNYAEDRTNIPIVPFHFEIMFDPSIINMERNLLENRLNLANYWISPLGERIEGNSIPPSNPPRMHVYRYRANPGAKSPVPVNVEIVYFDPKKDDPNGVPGLDSIRIFRAYPYLTLKELKQKREEERQKKRESYGYMNLCTGDTCPKPGIRKG